MPKILKDPEYNKSSFNNHLMLLVKKNKRSIFGFTKTCFRGVSD